MASEVWQVARLDFCLTRWERDDAPDSPTHVAVIHWLMDLRSHPRPPSAAPIPGSDYDMWLGEVPGTTVNVLYGISEETHTIVFITIDTL